MKRMVFKIGVIIVPLILSFSMVLVLNKHGGVAQYAQNLFETENDYRLKFVDSTDVELSLGETNKVIFPVDVISAREEAGKIYVETFENVVKTEGQGGLRKVLPALSYQSHGAFLT